MFKRIKTVIKIEKMSCKHCSNKVKLALEEVESVKKVIEELGYQVIDIIEG